MAMQHTWEDAQTEGRTAAHAKDVLTVLRGIAVTDMVRQHILGKDPAPKAVRSFLTLALEAVIEVSEIAIMSSTSVTRSGVAPAYMATCSPFSSQDTAVTDSSKTKPSTYTSWHAQPGFGHMDRTHASPCRRPGSLPSRHNTRSPRRRAGVGTAAPGSYSLHRSS
jgi:hypothetical protein